MEKGCWAAHMMRDRESVSRSSALTGTGPGSAGGFGSLEKHQVVVARPPARRRRTASDRLGPDQGFFPNTEANFTQANLESDR